MAEPGEPTSVAGKREPVSRVTPVDAVRSAGKDRFEPPASAGAAFLSRV